MRPRQQNFEAPGDMQLHFTETERHLNEDMVSIEIIDWLVAISDFFSPFR